MPIVISEGPFNPAPRLTIKSVRDMSTDELEALAVKLRGIREASQSEPRAARSAAPRAPASPKGQKEVVVNVNEETLE